MKPRFPGQRTAILRSDSASEYIYGALQTRLNIEGIASDPSMPYTPEQDGRSERYIKSVLTKSRCTFVEKKIPYDEWPYVVQLAVHILNHSPTRSNPQYKTPYELFYGRQPDVSHLRTPGSIVYCHIDKQKRVEKRFGARAVVRVLIGLENNGIVAMNPLDRKILKTCNFQANENLGWNDALFEITKNLDDNFVYEPSLDHSYAWAYIAKRGLDYTSLSDNIPMDYKEAMASPFSHLWIQAITDEFDSLFQNKVWTKVRATVNLPVNHKKLVTQGGFLQ